MGQPEKCPEDVFIELFETKGPLYISREYKIATKSVFARRRRLEIKIGRPLNAPGPNAVKREAHSPRIEISVPNGIVLVGSDAHIWPGPQSTAMRGFIKFCHDLNPKAVILNGDVLDFPQISRHPPIGWDHHPTVQEEIESAQEILSEIEAATFKAQKLWPIGNHDQRYETRLAQVAPEYAKLRGYSLKDWFPAWEPCWRVVINGNVNIKHRLGGGKYANRNNILRSGTHIITGHLHAAAVNGMNDYRNTTFWGVDTGCLADPDSPAFTAYTEDGPKDWRSAFCVLTFRQGALLQPELVLVYDDKSVQFRGEIIKV